MDIGATEVCAKCLDLVKSELPRIVIVNDVACIFVLHEFMSASKADDAEMAATGQ